MLHGSGRLERRRLIRLAVASVLVLGLVGAYVGLSHGGQAQVDVVPPDAAIQSRLRLPATATPHRTTVPRIVASADPKAFAAAVARALFDWDTSSPAGLAGYIGRLVALADPTGEESPGLVADIATYLPTPAAWVELRQYYTRQWIAIQSTRVPTLWPQAVAEAGPNGLAPGTTSYTIRGVRHRAGLWDGSHVTTRHEVAFTVFVVCRPSYPICHVLRLSKLDDPLR